VAANSREPGAFSLLCRTGLAAAVTIVVWAARADAQVAGIELHWSAPPRCPGADEVQSRVRRLAGAEGSAASTKQRLIADGEVVAAGGHYRLTLTVRQPTGTEGQTRVVESATCESLAGAAAVTLALLARGEARSGGAAPPPSLGAPASSSSSGASATASGSAKGTTSPTSGASTAPATSPSSAAPSPAAPAPVMAPSAAATTAGASANESAPGERPPPTPQGPFALQAPVLLVDAGVLPSLAYGLGIGARVRVGRVVVALTGALWLPQSAGGGGAFAASYQRRSAELSGCYAWSSGRFEVGPCLTMTLEDVTANGSGTDVVGQPGEVSWLTLGVGAQAGWMLTGWAALFLRPSFRLTTSRPTFAIDGVGPLYVGPLYQVPLAAAGVEMGCEWIL
jgi:hypothetical protein